MQIPSWVRPELADHHIYPTEVDEEGEAVFAYDDLGEEISARVERGQLVLVHTHVLALNQADMLELCNPDCCFFGQRVPEGLPHAD